MFAYVKFAELGSSSYKRIIPVENKKKFNAISYTKTKILGLENIWTHN